MTAVPDYQRASGELLHEIQMLYLLRNYFAERVLDRALEDREDRGLPARNASVEAFALHLRSLINFFYNHRGRGAQDDLVANDYVRDRKAYANARPKRDPALERDVVERISRQVVHLTYARGGYPPAESVWLYDKACQALDPVIRAFLAWVDPSKLVPRFAEQVERVLKPYQLRKPEPTPDARGTAVERPADFVNTGGTAVERPADFVD
jgi:hypothetical protein